MLYISLVIIPVYKHHYNYSQQFIHCKHHEFACNRRPRLQQYMTSGFF